MAEFHDYDRHDAERRLEETAQRYESRLAESERAHATAHHVPAGGMGRVRTLLLAVIVGAVIIGVLFGAYMLVRGSSTEEPPFLRCDVADNCPTPTPTQRTEPPLPSS